MMTWPSRKTLGKKKKDIIEDMFYSALPYSSGNNQSVISPNYKHDLTRSSGSDTLYEVIVVAAPKLPSNTLKYRRVSVVTLRSSTLKGDPQEFIPVLFCWLSMFFSGTFSNCLLNFQLQWKLEFYFYSQT